MDTLVLRAIIKTYFEVFSNHLPFLKAYVDNDYDMFPSPKDSTYPRPTLNHR